MQVEAGTGAASPRTGNKRQDDIRRTEYAALDAWNSVSRFPPFHAFTPAHEPMILRPTRGRIVLALDHTTPIGAMQSLWHKRSHTLGDHRQGIETKR